MEPASADPSRSSTRITVKTTYSSSSYISHESEAQDLTRSGARESARHRRQELASNGAVEKESFHDALDRFEEPSSPTSSLRRQADASEEEQYAGLMERRIKAYRGSWERVHCWRSVCVHWLVAVVRALLLSV